MNSKAIKDGWFEPREPKTKIGKALGFLYDQLDHHVIRHFIHLYDKVSRSLAFARLGWENFDFDKAYLFEVMVFKLERMHKCMQNGHVVQSESTMTSLREAIEICKRAENGHYESVYFDKHDKKWGELRMDTEPSKSGNPHGGSRILFSRPNAVTKKQIEQERKEAKAIWDKAEFDRKDDLARLGILLIDHSEGWWE